MSLTENQQRVLLALGLYAQACDPTAKIIARVCGLSEQEATEALHACEELGLTKYTPPVQD